MVVQMIIPSLSAMFWAFELCGSAGKEQFFCDLVPLTFFIIAVLNIKIPDDLY